MKHIALFLHDIHFRRKSGRLVFKQDEIVKYFFFHEGLLMSIKTNQKEERLGEILYQLGKLTPEIHAKIDFYIEPNMSIGEVLKKNGLITDRDLAEALAYQIREATLNTFPFFEADITFQEQALGGDVPKESRTRVPFLIDYGIRRMKFNPLIQGFFAKKTLAASGKTYAHLLTDEEKEILGKLSAPLAADALFASFKSDPEFFWKSLYLLYCLDLIDFRNEGEWKAPAGDKEPGREAEGENKAQISEVLEIRASLGSVSYYQLLGLSKEATETEIKKAYFNLARRFHPDRFDRSLSSEFRVAIDEVFDAISKAYRTLVNKEKRRLYDSTVPAAAGKDDGLDLSRKADIKFRQGKTLYSQGRYEEALVLLEEAVRMRRNKGDYFLLLAMAESKLPEYRKKAEEDFLKAQEMEPWNPEGYVGLGILYKNEDLTTKAARQFQKALDVDSDHRAARRELEELGLGDKKKGLKAVFSLDFLKPKKKDK